MNGATPSSTLGYTRYGSSGANYLTNPLLEDLNFSSFNATNGGIAYFSAFNGDDMTLSNSSTVTDGANNYIVTTPSDIRVITNSAGQGRILVSQDHLFLEHTSNSDPNSGSIVFSRYGNGTPMFSVDTLSSTTDINCHNNPIVNATTVSCIDLNINGSTFPRIAPISNPAFNATLGTGTTAFATPITSTGGYLCDLTIVWGNGTTPASASDKVRFAVMEDTVTQLVLQDVAVPTLDVAETSRVEHYSFMIAAVDGALSHDVVVSIQGSPTLTGSSWDLQMVRVL